MTFRPKDDFSPSHFLNTILPELRNCGFYEGVAYEGSWPIYKITNDGDLNTGTVIPTTEFTTLGNGMKNKTTAWAQYGYHVTLGGFTEAQLPSRPLLPRRHLIVAHLKFAVKAECVGGAAWSRIAFNLEQKDVAGNGTRGSCIRGVVTWDPDEVVAARKMLGGTRNNGFTDGYSPASLNLQQHAIYHNWTPGVKTYYEAIFVADMNMLDHEDPVRLLICLWNRTSNQWWNWSPRPRVQGIGDADYQAGCWMKSEDLAAISSYSRLTIYSGPSPAPIAHNIVDFVPFDFVTGDHFSYWMGSMQAKYPVPRLY